MTLPLAPQATLGDRYVLDERVAVGGMGEVWRATDSVLGRTVAVKVLKPEYAADPSFLQRFRDEARHTAALSHPGIANTFDYGEIGDPDGTYRAYLVMEYVAGEPLSAVLARAGRLPPDRALDVIGQAALALQAAHEAGVVHRDVKPGNLLLRPDGVVKVTDFGIARAIDAVPVTQTGVVVGTAAYLSPEQAAGKPVSPASDVYALGVVGYECLAGERPFADGTPVATAMAHISQPPRGLPKDVPPVVADFVMRALDKDPARRQPSAGDFGRTALALAASLREPAATAEPAQHPPTKVLPLPGDISADMSDTPAGEAAVADAGFDEATRRRVRNSFIAIGAVVVVIGFLLLRACEPSNTTTSTTRPSPRPSASSPSATPGIVVNKADYLGRPAAQAVAALQALGLHVRQQSAVIAGAPGTVVGVSPTGRLPRGATVTLTVAKAPPAPPARPAPPKKHGKGGGDGDH